MLVLFRLKTSHLVSSNVSLLRSQHKYFWCFFLFIVVVNNLQMYYLYYILFFIFITLFRQLSVNCPQFGFCLQACVSLTIAPVVWGLDILFLQMESRFSPHSSSVILSSVVSAVHHSFANTCRLHFYMFPSNYQHYSKSEPLPTHFSSFTFLTLIH